MVDMVNVKAHTRHIKSIGVAEPEQLTDSEKIDINLKEIARRVRIKLANEFPNCKFSVTTEYYSMGSSLHVSLMSCKGPQILRKFEDISESELAHYLDNRYTVEGLKQMQNRGYHQLNKHSFFYPYESRTWNNGVFLTREGHDLLKRVVQIVEYYNYDKSDSQTDYYDVNFSSNYSIGKWDKPFVQG